MPNQDLLTSVTRLRHTLHKHPELSGQERNTKELLKRYLVKHTSLALYDCAGGFYAVLRGAKPELPGIALRADYDALPLPGGGAAHLCGHDGHAAVLCGVARMLAGADLPRSVVLLFQSAEETGEGAKACLGLFQREQIGEIYGAHNLPGFPLGKVLTRTGTFAFASQGLVLRCWGKAAHAAQPELGRSPANAVGKFLYKLPDLPLKRLEHAAATCSVAGVRMGEKAFGTIAADAEIWLTLRAENDADLDYAVRAVSDQFGWYARTERLTFACENVDVFPATVNDAVCAQRVFSACGAEALEKPMRWSEDFGNYLKVCKGAMFGIGAGENHPPLHSAAYEYDDRLLLPGIRAFLDLVHSFEAA